RVELVDRLRRHGRDLHRDLLRQLLELRAARDEVGLARDLHERADASARVDVRRDGAFPGLAAGLLRDRREAALLQERLGLLVIPLRVLEGALAVHHSRAGLRAETLDLLGVDL